MKKISENFSQKGFDHAKQSGTDAPRTASETAIQKNSNW